MSDDEFLHQFETQTLPFESWNHRAHLKVAYLYLQRYPADVATNRICRNIQAYNAANGVETTPTSGYHETLTITWMKIVGHQLSLSGPAESADAFFDAHPDLGEKRAVLQYYSRERMLSPEARASFVEPDIAPFPDDSP